MNRVVRHLAWLAAFAAVAVYLAVFVSPVLNPPKWDEYIVAYDAHRVASGQVPYRDFFNFIPPGAFYFLAACFKLAGTSSLTVARWAGLLAALGTAILVALASRKRGWEPGAAFLWASVFPLGIYPFWAIASHHWLSALAFAGVAALFAADENLGPTRVFAAGCLTGLAGLCHQTQGLVLVAFCAAYLALDVEARRKLCLWPAWLGGILISWVPFLLLLAIRGGLSSFVRDVFLWPAHNYSRGSNENAGLVLQDVPWRMGDIWDYFSVAKSPGEKIAFASGFLLYPLVLALCVAVLAAAVLVLVRSIRRRRFEGAWAPAATLATVLGVGLTLRSNLDWRHLLYLSVPLSFLWICSLAGAATSRPAVRRACLVAAALVAASGIGYHTRGLWVHTLQSWELTDADRTIREQPINRFLHKPGNLAPGDTVAAFPEGGEVYLYGAPPAVGYTYFKPLDQEYNSVQDHDIVAGQIEKNRAKWILFPPDLEKDYLDPRSAVARVIARDYERQGVVGNAVVYRRKAA